MEIRLSYSPCLKIIMFFVEQFCFNMFEANLVFFFELLVLEHAERFGSLMHAFASHTCFR